MRPEPALPLHVLPVEYVVNKKAIIMAKTVRLNTGNLMPIIGRTYPHICSIQNGVGGYQDKPSTCMGNVRAGTRTSNDLYSIILNLKYTGTQV